VRTIRGDLDNRDELAEAVRAADEVEACARRSDLNRADIQGIVASGYNHLNHVRYVLLHIEDRAGAQRWLSEILSTVSTAQLRGHGEEKGNRRVNVAFTFGGLRELGLPDETLDGFSEEFRGGMTREGAAEILGDGNSDYDQWDFGGPTSKRIDILLLLYADTAAELCVLSEKVCGASKLDGWASEVWHQDSARSPGDLNEPFGFRDGISQPQVIGLVHKPPWRAKELIEPGEFILGHNNGYGVITPLPALASSYDSKGILRPHPECPGTHKDFAFDGSFLVVRKLEQDISAFSKFIEDHSKNAKGVSDPYQAELLAGRMVGRWRSGAPLAVTPERDCPILGTDPVINNSFLYRDDPDGLKCPIGAHVRRANPRDGQDFGPSCSFVLSQRHRIIRRGRKYSEDVTGPTGDKEPRQGIFFVAINADLRRQFEFLQSTWINNPSLMGLHNERDPVVGNNDEQGVFTIPGKSFDRHLVGLSRFVKGRGGAYFFLPGIAALEFLANCPLTADRTRSGMAAADAPAQ
jgi:Dyp-type peroxidase family